MVSKETIKQKEEKFIYVYGIINDKNTKLNFKGLRNKPIKKFNYRDISALTSGYPILHPIIKETEAMKHANILKKLAKKFTIIPMSFGSVFKKQEILKGVLVKSYQTIKNTLRLIDGKIELGVKVIKNQLDNIDTGIALKILESLNKLSIKSVKGDNFSERLLLNHSFLVEKSKFSKFSNKIAELERKNKNLKFFYTGPWPAYSFVNISIRGS